MDSLKRIAMIYIDAIATGAGWVTGAIIVLYLVGANLGIEL